MRIAISGGGIAGLTAGLLLAQRGVRPTIVEKAPRYGGVGYALTLWPLGSRVLQGLGLTDAFAERSREVKEYRISDSQGATLFHGKLATVLDSHSLPRTIERSVLIDLLSSSRTCPRISHGRTIVGLQERRQDVVACFSDGKKESFDLIIAADGIHSDLRARLAPAAALRSSDWRVGAWWLKDRPANPERIVEYWGRGRFLGVYPTATGGACAALLCASELGDGVAAAIKANYRSTHNEIVRWALDQLQDEEADAWALEDMRQTVWKRGRVAFIGDAAAPFLPTAGIGASMAMESAAVLVDELSRTASHDLGRALCFYERRRKNRVVRLQKQSRHLQTLMTLRRPLAVKSRDLAVKLLPPRLMLDRFAKAANEPI